MYDAIDCAFKMHFGTAYSLLRKPLKDDLFFIEQLYVKGYRFVSNFLDKPIKTFATEKIDDDEKKYILRKCCKKIGFFTGKRLFDLRYLKESKVSLEKIWNKSIHLITSNKHYATEDGNFNIVFAKDEETNQNIIYFYKVCSSIQLYFLVLLLNILKDENIILPKIFDVNLKRLFFAFSCTLDQGKLNKKQLDSLQIECNHCYQKIKITQEMIDRCKTSHNFYYKCDKCKKTYIIDNCIF